MDEVFFIDRDGNKISSDTMSSHYGLAHLILEQNENLKEEFEQSKRNDKVDFLIFEKGYLTVSNIGYYRKIKFSSLSITEKQRAIIEYFCEQGYEIDDLVLHHLKELEER